MNPYLDILVDEATGIDVPNEKYDIWEAGWQEGKREVVDWIKQQSQIEQCDPDVMAYFNEYRWVDETEWQAKLKEWGIEE